MAVNKNAVIRYMYLDQMLSDRHHYYTRAELTEKCNERLRMDGFSEVTKRTIEMDLIALQDAPFSMDVLGDLKSYIHKKYSDDKEAGTVKDNWL